MKFTLSTVYGGKKRLVLAVLLVWLYLRKKSPRFSLSQDHYDEDFNMYVIVHCSTGSVPSLTVTAREITNVFPASGSLRGGTELTVTGQGFSTVSSQNKVRVGNHDCDVQSSTSTELKCVIADTGKLHYVTNDGVHPGRRSLDFCLWHVLEIKILLCTSNDIAD
jgi:hypothetical protein